jgi:hypothetical protein
MDLSGVPDGTYCLKLVPGTGHNVIPGNLNVEDALGAFAVPVNAVQGDEVCFAIEATTVPCTAVITGWASMAVHDSFVDPLPIPLDPASAVGDVETRRDGVTEVVVSFNEVVPQITVGTVVANDLTNGGSIAASSQVIVDNGDGTSQLEIVFDPALPNEACYEIDLSQTDLCVADGQDLNCLVRALVGNTNGDDNTNLIDMAQVKSLNGQPVWPDNIRLDVNLDGNLNLIDMALVKSLNGDGPVVCP